MFSQLVLVCFCPAFSVEFQVLQFKSFSECTFVRQSARQLMQRKFQYLTKNYIHSIAYRLAAMLTVSYIMKSKFQTKVLRFERIFIQYVEFFLVWLSTKTRLPGVHLYVKFQVGWSTFLETKISNLFYIAIICFNWHSNCFRLCIRSLKASKVFSQH